LILIKSKRSINANTSGNKENKEDNDETLFDETLTNDPNKHLNKRAKTMVSLLNKGFNKNDNVGFFEMTKRNGKKSVVQKFYSLLVLKKYEIIDLFQEEHYGDIIISKGDKFDNFASS
jgi:cohesin complex subunit SCC1